MRNFRSTIGRSAAITAAALALVVSPAGAAMASGHSILRNDLRGIFPPSDVAHQSPVVAGVSPGLARWVLDPGSRVRVREDGRISVVVKHLVIPGRVPGNPALRMAASLVCDDMVVGSTQGFDVSPDGDGRFSGRVAGTHDCDDPVVLIRNAANPAALGSYFAFAMDD